jgi:hypothetical protein
MTIVNKKPNNHESILLMTNGVYVPRIKDNDDKLHGCTYVEENL